MASSSHGAHEARSAGAGLASGDSAQRLISTAASAARTTKAGGCRTECGVFARHYGALLKKRARYGRRDYKSLCCVMLLPSLLLLGGLMLLKYGGQVAQPDFALSLASFNEDPYVLPYNASSSRATGGALARALARSGNSVRVAPRSVPVTAADAEAVQQVFGLYYKAGLKCGCNESSLPPFGCGTMLELLQNPLLEHVASQQGLSAGCSTTRETCAKTLSSACAPPDNALCNAACMAQGGQDVNKQICEQGCLQLCQVLEGFGNASVLCEILPTPGPISQFCPDSCDVCPPPSAHSRCITGSSNIVQPGLTLAMLTEVYKQGQGSTLADAAYSALLLPRADAAQGVGESAVTVLCVAAPRSSTCVDLIVHQ